MKEIVAEFADDFGYDLDEEGKPIDEDVEVDDRRKRGDDEDEDGGAEEEEPAPAAA